LVERAPIPLESLWRALPADETAQAVRHFAAVLPAASFAQEFTRLFREVFFNTSLSPYTSFVDTAIAFVTCLVEIGALSEPAEADMWSWLLRQLARHLTAYDLITFHHRGANYPDALLLDAVLARFMSIIEAHPELFRMDGKGDEAGRHRLRRRALRQGCLVRRYYEGHPIPDAPTAPGENARVLPPPHVRVPEEQLLNCLRRRKRLFEGKSLPTLMSHEARAVLYERLLDLTDERERRELGTAVFIERPFGWGKALGEPDLTPLLAHELYSPSIARRRFSELERLGQELCLEDSGWKAASANVPGTAGLPVAQLAEPDRPVVSLADARRVADDFVILRGLPRGLSDVFQVLDFKPLRAHTSFPNALEKLSLVRLPSKDGTTVLAWFDGQWRPRLEMVADLSQGFLTRKGIEMPAAGLRVTRIRRDDGEAEEVDVEIPRA
jgi:hypothetical protein